MHSAAGHRGAGRDGLLPRDMRPLRLAGALRVAEGVTTLEKVIAATPPLESRDRAGSPSAS
ncbi:hypothetical protein GO496_16185 [Acidovorax citrulli]|nr:hypothetical protein [Paracidovorax citrulli]MVT38231.1 hypothetical protein [Paracidovorax citrulli]